MITQIIYGFGYELLGIRIRLWARNQRPPERRKHCSLLRAAHSIPIAMATMTPSNTIASLLRSSHLFSARALISPPHCLFFAGGRGLHVVRVGGTVSSRRRRLRGVRAAQVNESGSIDSPMMRSMENKIKEELNADIVTVKDAYGDGRHVSIYVVSSAFEGQSDVNRQRMVYKAIWEEIQSIVHAVDEMIIQTPAEAMENQ